MPKSRLTGGFFLSAASGAGRHHQMYSPAIPVASVLKSTITRHVSRPDCRSSITSSKKRIAVIRESNDDARPQTDDTQECRSYTRMLSDLERPSHFRGSDV